MENENETVEVKEEVKNPDAVLAELRRAQEDLKTLRAENKRLTDAIAAAPNEDEFKKRAIAAETKLALAAQGIKDTDRLMPYIGTDGIDFDEEGNLTGLNERVAQLKIDLPEVFDPKRRVGGKADIFADNATETKKSSTEMQVAKIFGRT